MAWMASMAKPRPRHVLPRIQQQHVPRHVPPPPWITAKKSETKSKGPVPSMAPELMESLRAQDSMVYETSHKVRSHNEDTDSEYELVEVEEVDEDKEKVIRRTKQILQNHGCSTKASKGNFGRRSRRKRGGKSGKSAQAFRSRTWRASSSGVDDRKRERCQVPVSWLRYSQRSCKETFACGRAVSKLVRDLWYGKVRVSAPFLRLTVFERPDSDGETGRPMLRCINNRRLYALKQYAEWLGEKNLLVHVDLYNMRTCNDLCRLIQNSDLTDGKGVLLRKKKNFKNAFF